MVSDEQRRVNLLQKEADGVTDQLRTRRFTSNEEKQALLLRSGQLANELREAKAAAAVAESQYRLAQQTLAVQRTNASAAAQVYQTQLNTLASLREQLGVEKDLNTTRARGLQLTIDQGENALRIERQNAGYGKTPGQMQEKLRKDKIDRANRDRFDTHVDKNDGLLNVQRGMNGEILSGTDMVSGLQRAPRPGMGRGEQGLHTGSLGDKPVSTTGGPSLIKDLDPDGGLSTPGTTPRMFARSSAAERLDHPTTASRVLSDHAGDPAHDPAARLRDATIFPNLTGEMNKGHGSQNHGATSTALMKSALGQHIITNSLMGKLIGEVHALGSTGWE